MTTLGYNIKRLREKAGKCWLITESYCFDDKLRWTLIPYEKGEKLPTPEHIMRMAEFFGCDWREFFFCCGLIFDSQSGKPIFLPFCDDKIKKLFIECLSRSKQMSEKRTFGGNLAEAIFSVYAADKFIDRVREETGYRIADLNLDHWMHNKNLPTPEYLYRMVKTLNSCHKNISVNDLFHNVDLDDTKYPGLCSDESMRDYRDKCLKYEAKRKEEESNKRGPKVALTFDTEPRTFGSNLERLIKKKFATVSQFVHALNDAARANNFEYIQDRLLTDRLYSVENFIKTTRSTYPSHLFLYQMTKVLNCECKDFFVGLDLSEKMYGWSPKTSDGKTLGEYLEECKEMEGGEKEEQQKKKPRTLEDNIRELIEKHPNAKIETIYRINGVIFGKPVGNPEVEEEISIKHDGEITYHSMSNLRDPKVLANFAFRLDVFVSALFDGIPHNKDGEIIRLRQETICEKNKLYDKKTEMQRQERIVKEEKEKAERFMFACRNCREDLIDDDEIKKEYSSNWEFLKHVNLAGALKDIMKEQLPCVLEAILKVEQFKQALVDNLQEIILLSINRVLDRPTSDYEIKNFAIIISQKQVKERLSFTNTVSPVEVSKLRQKIVAEAEHRNVIDMMNIFYAFYYPVGSGEIGLAFAEALIKDILER